MPTVHLPAGGGRTFTAPYVRPISFGVIHHMIASPRVTRALADHRAREKDYLCGKVRTLHVQNIETHLTVDDLFPGVYVLKIKLINEEVFSRKIIIK